MRAGRRAHEVPASRRPRPSLPESFDGAEALQPLPGHVMDYVYFLSPYVMAMAIATGMVLAVNAAALASRHWNAGARLATLLCAIFLGETVSGLFTGRLLHSELEIAQNPWLGYQIIETTAGGLVKKAAVAVMLLVSAGELMARLLRRAPERRPVDLPLLLAFAWYYLAMVWISAVFGTVREYSQAWLYAPILFGAVGVLAPEGGIDALRPLRWVLVLGLVLNLAPALAEVKRVFEPGYVLSPIGLPWRLHGVASHANGLGGVALLLLILELSPLLKPRINGAVLALALAVLVLAQSKTTWVAAVLCVPVLRWSELQQFCRRHALALVGLSCVMGAILAVWLPGSDGPARLYASLFEVSADELFTGRVAIWKITWDTFLQSPVFGYGPALWDPVFRAEHNWWAAGHAHNQMLQVLGQAGLFGAVAWTAFIALMARGIWRQGPGPARRLGFALLLALLCRCWSEAPMNMLGISGADGLGQLVVFAVAAAGCGAAARHPAPWRRALP